MIRPKNLRKHEFIGLEIEVIESKNKSQKGIKGKVIDETKNTLKIETLIGEKIVPKMGSVFRFALPRGKKSKIRGDCILTKPEERVKK